MKSAMMYWHRILAAVTVVSAILLPPTTASAQTLDRPISDFLSQQGKLCGIPCGLFPPIANAFNFLLWANHIVNDTPPARSADSLRCAVVDYAGLLGYPGTTFSGRVTDRPLNDGSGQSEVTVVLKTNNAVTWVFAGDNAALSCGNDFALQPLLFGTRWINGVPSGATPTLGDSELKAVFTNTHVGAPLPDLLEFNVFPSPRQGLRSITFTASAAGPLHAAFGVPDGTPGRLQITQKELFTPNMGGATVDAFPVENVDLTKTGK